MYMSITTKPMLVLTQSQFSTAKTGVEPFILITPTPPKPQRSQAPAGALTQPSTGRSRLSTFSLGMAHTITQPSSPAPFVAPASPILGRSRSADSLSTRDRDLGLTYKAKWRGGNLQLSHSNLRPKQGALKKEIRSRTP